MIIKIEGGRTGWAEYVLDGTIEKPRDSTKVKIIDGDVDQVKEIYEKLNYERDNYTKIMISFENDLDDEKIQEAYEEWKENFLIGQEDDEYAIAAVLHKDTKHKHIHICIPKINLLTGTSNDYYLHKRDQTRVNNLKEYLNLKYDFKDGTKNSNEVELEVELESLEERIARWKKEHNQGDAKFQKNLKIDFVKQIQNDLNNTKFNNFKEMEDLLNGAGFKIIKDGWQGTFINKETEEKEVSLYWLDLEYIIEKDGKETKENIRIKGKNYGKEYFEKENRRTETERELIQEYKNTIPQSGLGRTIGNAKITRTNTEPEYRQIFIAEQKLKRSNKYRIKQVKEKFTNSKGEDKREICRRKKWKEYKQIKQELDLSNNNNITNDNSISMETTTNIPEFKTSRQQDSNDTRGKKSIKEEQHLLLQNKLNNNNTIGQKMQNLEKYKQELNLVNFIISQGGELNKLKSSHNSKSIKFKDNHLIISKSPQGDFIYFNIDNKVDRGNIFNFYKNHIGDKDMLKNLDLYLKDDNFYISAETNIEQKKEIDLKWQERILENIKESHLEKLNLKRGFNIEVLKSLELKIDKMENLTFKSYKIKDDGKNELVGFEKINLDTQDKKIIGNKGISYLINGNNPKNIYIFESMLDAIAFKELHPYNAGQYISFNGSITPEQTKTFYNLLNKYKEPTILNCFDNDTAGLKIFESLKDDIIKIDKKYEFIFSNSMQKELKENNAKDFNALLKIQNNKDNIDSLDNMLNQLNSMENVKLEVVKPTLKPTIKEEVDVYDPYTKSYIKIRKIKQ